MFTSVVVLQKHQRGTESWDAGVDAVGVLADSAALALPFVPGGAGAAIKAGRAGTATAQQLNQANRLTRGVDAVQAVDQAVTVVDSTARARESLRDGHFGEAAFNTGMAMLGARGTVANSGAARRGSHYSEASRPRGPPSGAMVVGERADGIGARLEPAYNGSVPGYVPSPAFSYRPGDLLPDGRIAGDGPGAVLRNGPDFVRRIADEQSRDALGKFLSKTSPGQRIPGGSSVDDFAQQARKNGFEIVGHEIAVNTPFGQRRYDVVLRNHETGAVHAIEIKSSHLAFDRFDQDARRQFAADRWLNSSGGAEIVGEKAGIWIDDATKVLWELE